MKKIKLFIAIVGLFVFVSCQKQETVLQSVDADQVEMTGIVAIDMGFCSEEAGIIHEPKGYLFYDQQSGKEYRLSSSSSLRSGVDNFSAGDIARVTGDFDGNGNFVLTDYTILSAKENPGKGGGNGGGGNGGGDDPPVPQVRSVLGIIMNSQEYPAITTVGEMENMLFNDPMSVDAFYSHVSSGDLSFEGQVVSLDISDSGLSCPDIPTDHYYNEANAQLSAMGINIADYDHLVYVFPFEYCPYAPCLGHNAIGSPMTRLWACIDSRIMVHEIGHSLGLGHSTDPVNYTEEKRIEYGDGSCPMGHFYNEFNAVKKDLLGLISTVNVDKKGGTYQVVSGSNYSVPGDKACILKIGQTPYYISYRSENGIFDVNIEPFYKEKVNVHRTTYSGRSAFVGSISLGSTLPVDRYVISFDALNNDVATVTISK